MAIEKSKVLAALQLKFKGKSISKTYLEKLATRYATKIETDADLDDYINEREEDIIDAGTEADRRVTAALKKPAEGPKPTATTETEIDEDELKDAPPYVKVMMKQMQGMTKTIEGLQAEKTVQSLTERFLKDERLKGLDAKLLKGRYPKTEEDFENAVTEAAEDLKDFIKEGGNEQPGANGTPLTGVPIQTRLGSAIGDRPVHTPVKASTPASAAKEVPPEIKQFTESLNKSKTTT